MGFADEHWHDVPTDEDMFGGRGRGRASYRRKTPNTYTTVDCTIKTQTDKAWLICVTDETDTEMVTWVPKSQCTFDEKKDCMMIPDWLLENLDFKEDEWMQK
jgi:hypothetical protein